MKKKISIYFQNNQSNEVFCSIFHLINHLFDDQNLILKLIRDIDAWIEKRMIFIESLLECQGGEKHGNKFQF